MSFCVKGVIPVVVIILVVMVGALDVPETYAEDDITVQKLLGIWWTYREQVPWAIQFNEDGTFRSAHTVLRLQSSPEDEGRFKLEGTSLTLISHQDCEGYCKGMKGVYKVEFTKLNQLLLKPLEDECSARKTVCNSPWVRATK